MKKEDFILMAVANMAGPMISARDEYGKQIYTLLDVKREAISLAEEMTDYRKQIIGIINYSLITYDIYQAIIEAKRLEADNDYGSRRGRIDNILDRLKNISKEFENIYFLCGQSIGHIFEDACNEFEEESEAIRILQDELNDHQLKSKLNV